MSSLLTLLVFSSVYYGMYRMSWDQPDQPGGLINLANKYKIKMCTGFFLWFSAKDLNLAVDSMFTTL